MELAGARTWRVGRESEVRESEVRFHIKGSHPLVEGGLTSEVDVVVTLGKQPVAPGRSHPRD